MHPALGGGQRWTRGGPDTGREVGAVAAAGEPFGGPVAVHVADRGGVLLAEGGVDGLLHGALAQELAAPADPGGLTALEEAHQHAVRAARAGVVEDDAHRTLVGAHLAGQPGATPPRVLVDKGRLDHVAGRHLGRQVGAPAGQRRHEVQPRQQSRRQGDDGPGGLHLLAVGERDHHPVGMLGDPGDQGAQPHPSPQISGHPVADRGHPAGHPLLVHAAVHGGQAFQVHTVVDALQALQQAGLAGAPAHGTVEDPLEPLPTAGGAQIGRCPGGHLLLQPLVVGVGPGGVLGDALGQPPEAQQALTQVGHLERGQVLVELVAGQPHVAAVPGQLGHLGRHLHEGDRDRGAQAADRRPDRSHARVRDQRRGRPAAGHSVAAAVR